MRQVRVKEAPAQPGEAIQAKWTTRHELAKLRALVVKAKKQRDLWTWRRSKAVRDYIHGKKVLAIATGLEVSRAAVNQWLRWYDTAGTEALLPRKAPGPAPRLTPAQHEELTRLIEEGPQAVGYTGGIWTGPRIGDLIRRRFGIRYHNHHIPRLLHQLGFSVQRPRKRLARADQEAQELWLTKRLPAIRRKAARCRGVVVFEDEASFWQDGSQRALPPARRRGQALAARESPSHRTPSPAGVLAGVHGDGGRVENDAQAHDAQCVLRHPGPTRCQADRDLQGLRVRLFHVGPRGPQFRSLTRA